MTYENKTGPECCKKCFGMVKHLLALLFSIKLIHWKEMVPRETVLVEHVSFFNSTLDTWKANPLLNIYSHGNSRLGSLSLEK